MNCPQRIEIATDQRFLLCARPPLDLALRRDRIGDALEPIRENQDDRTTRRSVSAVGTGIVLRHAQFQPLARGSAIVAAVRAAQNVNVCAVDHGRPRPSRRGHASRQRPDNCRLPSSARIAEDLCRAACRCAAFVGRDRRHQCAAPFDGRAGTVEPAHCLFVADLCDDRSHRRAGDLSSLARRGTDLGTADCGFVRHDGHHVYFPLDHGA